MGSDFGMTDEKEEESNDEELQENGVLFERSSPLIPLIFYAKD